MSYLTSSSYFCYLPLLPSTKKNFFQREKNYFAAFFRFFGHEIFSDFRKKKENVKYLFDSFLEISVFPFRFIFPLFLCLGCLKKILFYRDLSLTFPFIQITHIFSVRSLLPLWDVVLSCPCRLSLWTIPINFIHGLFCPLPWPKIFMKEK